MSEQRVDAVIVGAGFAGMYALHRLVKENYHPIVFETGDNVGGTWYWNRYPGARCDIQSMEYSYTFDEDLQQDWNWSEKYAPQPEILRYANYVADRFELRQHINFNTRVLTARYDEIHQEFLSLLPSKPDLLIRTGGEHRLSDFVMFHLGYAELFFLDVKWPDFTKQHLVTVLNQYELTERRFGKVGEAG